MILYTRKSKKKIAPASLYDFKILERELIRQIKTDDVILLAIRFPSYFGGTYYGNSQDVQFFREDGSLISEKSYFVRWIKSVKKIANIAHKKGGKVIIQTPTPEWGKEKSELCTKNEWFNISQTRDCKIKSKFFVDETTGLHSHLFEKLNKLSTLHKNIYLLYVIRYWLIEF